MSTDTATLGVPAEPSAAALASSDPEQLAAAADRAIAAARAGIDRIADGRTSGTMDLLEIYDEAAAALTNAAGLAEVVTEVHPDPQMRAAAEAATQRIHRYTTEISLDRRVYDALSGADLAQVDPAARHWMERTLRELRRAGVHRDDATRQRVRALRQQLVEVEQEFARNINSDTRSAELPATALSGLPEDWLRNHPPGADGTVTVTTENPDVVPVLTYCHDADVRERMLRLWRQRGHPANQEVLRRMLALRHELATLLGYRSWAAYATEEMMIGDEQAAADFIARISDLATGRMRRDYAALLSRKQVDEPGATTVEAWDRWYLERLVRSERYALDAQRLRPYFEYARVRDGLMAVAAEMFGVRFEPRPDAPVWHPEVEAYDVREGAALLGRIFLDMHPRPDKFGHAAMYDLVTGKAGVRVPECALLCNFPRPGELLEHSHVETFFHEFGHLLHHVFAGHQRWSSVSGISTERDFIEAPSMLLEEWTRDAATLATFARHHQTGEPLPAELVGKLRAADAFGRGLWVRQQMSYSALSLELHRHDPDGLDPLEVEREVQLRHAPYPPMPDTWLHLSFGHLQGYSARYYTYVWSLVIAKDLFTAFDAGDLLGNAAATRYRDTVLAAGGSAPAAELVRRFLGRDYTFDAFGAWLEG